MAAWVWATAPARASLDAIHVINGVAVVDRKKCTGCTACTVTCPRHVIQMKPIAPQPAVMCSNKDKGALVNKTCKVGCIACGLCVRNCPNQAIFLKDNVAVIDYTKCNGCGTCVSKCPKKAIQWVEGTPRPIGRPRARARGPENARIIFR